MKKIKSLLNLFWTFFKIGLFTFGGGYAMVAVIEREIVEKRKYIGQEEFLDLIAIAESTPGPIAVNSATYIGYKLGGVLGSFFATLGVVLPSFLIVFIISFFYEKFLALEYVSYAFKGIQACVAFLIISAGIKMLKGLKKNLFNVIMFISTLVLMLVIKIFDLPISSIYLILVGGLIGVIVWLFARKKVNNKGEKNQ